MRCIFIILVILILGCPRQKFVEINCYECNGTGIVIYDENHPSVKLGFYEGKYPCPICGGYGKLNKLNLYF